MSRFLSMLMLVLATGLAEARDLVVAEDEQTDTLDCGGGSITLQSNHNRLVLHHCARVVVNGNFNTVEAEAPERVEVLGNDNQVTWTTTDPAVVPSVSNLGNRNRVKAGRPGTASLEGVATAIAVAGDTRADLLTALGAVEKADRIELNLTGDVLFDFGKAEVRPDAAETLSKVGRLIEERAADKVYVVGHSDSVGDDAGNLALSQARARSVVDWLQRNAGIASNRLAARGMGETRPLAPNSLPDGSDNPEGRARNRRVEFFLPTRAGVDLEAALGLAVAVAPAPQGDTSCAAGRTCTADCPEGKCTMTCPAGAICDYACAGGGCNMQCSAGAHCNFGCRGGHCEQICAFGAHCERSCEGGGCRGN